MLDLVASGDGSCNQSFAKVLRYARFIELLSAAGHTDLADAYRDSVHVRWINSNKHSLEVLTARFPKNLHPPKTFVLGKRGIGAQLQPEIGRRFAEEAFLDGSLGEFLETDSATVIFDLSIGEGGTSMGAGPVILDYLYKQQVFVAPIITTASLEKSEINERQAVEIEDFLRRLDREGRAYMRGLTEKMYQRGFTKPRALARIDEVSADTTAGFIRLRAMPTDYDQSNLLAHFYVNSRRGERGKRWYMSAAHVPPEDEKSMKEAIEKILSAPYFQFNWAEAGGIVVIVEGDLDATMYPVMLQEIRKRNHRIYGQSRNTDEANPNLRVRPVTYPGFESKVRLTLWAAEYTGEVNPDDLPELRALQPREFVSHTSPTRAAVAISGLKFNFVSEDGEGTEFAVSDLGVPASRTNLPPKPKLYFTFPDEPYRDWKSFLIAAKDPSSRQHAMMKHGNPFNLYQHVVCKDQGGKDIPLFLFFKGWAHFGGVLISEAQALYEVWQILGTFSDSWLEFFKNSLENRVTQTGERFIRYAQWPGGTRREIGEFDRIEDLGEKHWWKEGFSRLKEQDCRAMTRRVYIQWAVGWNIIQPLLKPVEPSMQDKAYAAARSIFKMGRKKTTPSLVQELGLENGHGVSELSTASTNGSSSETEVI